MANVPLAHVGEVTSNRRLQIAPASEAQADWLIDLPLGELKEAWQKPLRW